MGVPSASKYGILSDASASKFGPRLLVSKAVKALKCNTSACSSESPELLHFALARSAGLRAGWTSASDTMFPNGFEEPGDFVFILV